MWRRPRTRGWRRRNGRVSRAGERLKDAICDPDRNLCGTHGLVEKVFVLGARSNQEEMLSSLAYGIHTRGKVERHGDQHF